MIMPMAARDRSSDAPRCSRRTSAAARQAPHPRRGGRTVPGSQGQPTRSPRRHYDPARRLTRPPGVNLWERQHICEWARLLLTIVPNGRYGAGYRGRAYDFSVRNLRWLVRRLGARPLAHVVPDLEGVARSSACQNKFRRHQPIRPSQSTWTTKAIPPNTMRPNGMRGSLAASISVPITAATSISLAAWMSIVCNPSQKDERAKAAEYTRRQPENNAVQHLS
jgi:hypothetical protein